MPDPTSLPDLLAKALLEARFGNDRVSAVTKRTVSEALVPAVLAALTVPPDQVLDDEGMKAPTWNRVPPVGRRISVWEDELDFGTDGLGPKDITPAQVEHAARVLFSVAQEMRKHSAWKENE